MKLEDHEKLAYNVIQLERKALFWWDYMVLTEREDNTTWKLFIDRVREVPWRSSTLWQGLGVYEPEIGQNDSHGDQIY